MLLGSAGRFVVRSELEGATVIVHLESEAERIYLVVTASAGWVGAVQLEAFAKSEIRVRRGGLDRRNVGRRFAQVFAEDAAEHPSAAQNRSPVHA